MKLESRYNNGILKEAYRWKEYRCDLTKELDVIADMSKQHFYDRFHHYVLVDDLCKKSKVLAIRVPGGTVGSIYFDDDNVITEIVIDTDYVVKTYPINVNDLIQKFVGEVIEWQ